MKIRIRWEVEDGYAGKSRPQHTVFDTDDVSADDDEWNSYSEDEKEAIIRDAVQDDFDNKISFVINDYGLED